MVGSAHWWPKVPGLRAPYSNKKKSTIMFLRTRKC